MKLREKVLGSVIGQAVGDAIGFPFEGWLSEKIQPHIDSLFKEFTPHPSGIFSLGQYTDDTQMMREILSSMVEKQGLDPEDIAWRFVELWKSKLIVGQGMACRESILRIINGEASWMDSGAEEGKAGNGAAMRATPIGIMNFNDPENLPWNVILLSRITHKDARACAGAVAVASTISYTLKNDSINADELTRLISTIIEPISEEFSQIIMKLPELLAMDERKALQEIANLGLDDDMKSDTHEITPFVIPTVMIALWSFLKSPMNYIESVLRVISAGGDVDTTAAVTGAISGAFNGIHGIPEHLARKINDRGEFGYEYFQTLVTRLVDEYQMVKSS